jgi:hypothetical protein
MPCLERSRGTECPYRGSLGCTEADKAFGIEMGRCVFEMAHRQALIEEYDRYLKRIPAELRPEYASAVFSVIDALIYAMRATVWQAIVCNGAVARGEEMSSSEEVVIALRYAEAGTNRLVRAYARLRGVQEQAAELWRTCAGSRAAVGARKILDEATPGWDRSKVLGSEGAS